MARRNRCFVNFINENSQPVFAAGTGAVVTAANAQQDYFYVNGNYFDFTQGVGSTGANTQLATTGLTAGTTGWLLPGDNTATDSIELTNGIQLGKGISFLTGTDAFYLRVCLRLPTLGNFTHVLTGFRKLGAYVTANTLAEAKTAYDDKALFGINDNAGTLARETSLATSDVEVAAAHAAPTAADVIAIEMTVSAARKVVCKFGHYTPTGTTAALMEVARLGAIADLAVDATVEATVFSMTTATNVIPTLIYGMKGSAAISDMTILSWDVGHQ